MKNYAVIDLGSVKAKLLVGSVLRNKVKILKKESTLTCLGEGIDRSRPKICQKPLYDTIKTIESYKKISKKLKVSQIKVIATESLRKAKNIRSVMSIFKKETDLLPKIISKDEEAQTFFKAVVKDFPASCNVAVVDMGGGSIQVLVGKDGKLEDFASLPLGSYLLHQKFIKDNTHDGKATKEELKTLKDFIRHKINSLKVDKSKSIPLIYGSSNVLDLFQFLKLQLYPSSLSPTHPFKAHPSELLKFLDKINDLTYKEREEKYPFQWGYMWGIQMAFYNAFYLAKFFNTEEIIPSNVNIAEGYLLEMASDTKSG